MAQYKVVLTAMALVEQVHYVDAESYEEAQDAALGNYNNEIWHYQLLNDETVEAIGTYRL